MPTAGGRFCTADAIKRMRMRLLDLSTNNRLLSYRFPRGRALRIVDTPMDPLFESVYFNGKSARIVSLPEPPLELYENRNGVLCRPDEREFAAYCDIAVSYENATSPRRPNPGDIQCLHYAEDLERILRKLDQSARTALEESGTNMLYLVFGYLEWFESQDSDKPLLAPLLPLPVALRRIGVDPETGYFQYVVEYSGDDVTENITLREKLRQSFGLELPSLDDNDTPEQYFSKIVQFAKPHHRWTLRWYETLSLLSFGKLLMYLDLDPERWPPGSRIEQHNVIRTLFEGSADQPLEPFAEEHDIDEHETANSLPLVYDADSSQHSALLDAMDGRNLVVEGPPGTGKSQTITNLIAAALTKGKTVLFMSEKLAALEVVRRRLDKVKLGDFCLELHSHKTQKRKLLDEIARRLQATFSPPLGLEGKISEIESKRRQLNRYVGLLNSVHGNRLEQTIHQCLWAAERYRTELGSSVAALHGIEFPFAPTTDPEGFTHLEEAIEQLRRHLESSGHYGPTNPWWGFSPIGLLFGDDDVILGLLQVLADAANDIHNSTVRFGEVYGPLLPEEEAVCRSHCGLGLETLPALNGTEAVDLLPALLLDGRMDRIQRLERAVGVVCSERPVVQSRLRSMDTPPDQVVTAIALCERAGELNQLDVRQSEIARRGTAIKSLVAQCQTALELLAEVAASAEVPRENTLEGLALVAAVVRVAENAPLDVLHLRTDCLSEPTALDVISNARVKSEALLNERRALEQLFDLNLLPPRDDVACTLQILVDSRSIFRVLRRQYWHALRKYREMCHSAHLKTPLPQAVQELRQLLHFLDERDGIHGNAEFRRLAGSAFAGIETDFAKLERIAQWYRDSHTALSPYIHPTDPGMLGRLLNLGPHPLAWLKAHAREGQQAWRSLANLNNSLESIFTNDRQPPTQGIGKCDQLDTALVRLGELAKALERISTTISGLCTADESPRAFQNLLATLLKLRDALTEMKAPAAADLLGVHHRGPNTDFSCIHAAYKWGRTVQELGAPERIREWLLSPHAKERTAALSSFLDAVSPHWKTVTSIRTQLERFGSLDWQAWHRGQSITPQLIRDRALEASAAGALLVTWANLARAIQNANELGVENLTAVVLRGELPVTNLPSAFRYCFYATIARRLMRGHPELMYFSGLSHDHAREKFSELDRQILELNGQKCAVAISRRLIPRGVATGNVRDYSELALLNHEISKRRRHIPIRQLVQRAGSALQAVKPCFMLGPLSVAQYLPPGALSFDLVIMDEASQLKPEDALGVIGRGSQLVVVGDPKQLPPTTFFDTLGEESIEADEDSTALEESESILDYCQTRFRPVRRLRWHYRSRHESLIRFSNHHFYRDRPLFLFPSPHQQHDRLGVRYHLVESAVYGNRANPKEAASVADAAIEQMRQSPDESLGVATLNISQCELIQEEIDRRIKEDGRLQGYLDEWRNRGEPFFVKNLENVQGDERDVVIISTTYGRNSEGILHQRFGPITRKDGWRRLNVLFTRARIRVELYTSMEAEDIRLDSSSSAGVQALRNYLFFAKTGQLDAGSVTGREPDSDFEVSVGEVLRQAGYDPVPQLGIAGFFIDIAVRNSEREGEFLAAVECDGATYHSSRSARDRDRLRQEVLERLGWKGKIYRIWSADWFKDPRTQTERLLMFLEACRRRAQAEPTTDLVAAATPGPQAEPPLPPPPQPPEPVETVVQIWDYVTYCYLDDPERAKSVQIVRGHTDTEQGVVGNGTPLARALLGAEIGAEVEMNVPGREPRRLRVLSIER